MRRYVLGLLLIAFSLLPAVSVRADDASLTKIEPLTIATETDAFMFTVEIAETEEQRSRGLMFRQRLPEDRGMLFDFGKPRPVSMWMKNTYISLDMLFIRADGTIARIAERTEPLSTRTIPSGEPVLSVLEINGGVSKQLGIKAGDKVEHALFKR
jgi:uncharacterized membrane protein (UPF0127 family)